MKKLSRIEMKNIKGGDETVDPGGGSGGCMEEYVYDCHLVRSPFPCCAGLTCEENGTGTGTLCMAT